LHKGAFIEDFEKNIYQRVISLWRIITGLKMNILETLYLH